MGDDVTLLILCNLVIACVSMGNFLVRCYSQVLENGLAHLVARRSSKPEVSGLILACFPQSF